MFREIKDKYRDELQIYIKNKNNKKQKQTNTWEVTEAD